MACSLTNVVRFVINQAACRTHALNRHILPTGCYMLKIYGYDASGYQQCRTKTYFKEYKFSKPVKFDNRGDHGSLERVDESTILFKYRDIPELETLPEELKKLFTAEFARSREITEHRHMMMQERMTKHLGPEHNLEKQIAYLTVKIRNLTLIHPRRRSNKREKAHIVERIAKRNKFLGYLRQLDFERYAWIQKELNLRYIPFDKYNYFRPGRRAARKKEVREAMIKEIHDKYQQCKLKFQQELTAVEKEKLEVLAEIKEYGLNGKEIADQLMKDLKEKQDERKKQKISPKFREFEKEKKLRKLKEAYVF